MKKHQVLLCLALGILGSADGELSAAIRRHPTGVNVNTNGATTVFITFGNLQHQVAVEAFWCGELMDAFPDLGFKCKPGTIFGRLPLRFDLSRMSGQSAFTDIMSIPPSVARRAYQAAQRGATSSFFYVRRFASTTGGPDEYVFVTCRLAGVGARTPLALVDVRLYFSEAREILTLEPGAKVPPFAAEIRYTGTGRLKGRWELVLPGEEPPRVEDLLTEATLPVTLRGRQRRYTELARFNIFLPPTGRVTLPGPDPARLPTAVEGLYWILLRIEASQDKEADSDLAAAGAGQGLVHSGAVAGFPLPPLRYIVARGAPVPSSDAVFAALLPEEGHRAVPDKPVVLSWTHHPAAGLYRVELVGPDGGQLVSALVPAPLTGYQLPTLLVDTVTAVPYLQWRIIALDPLGEERAATPWRTLQWEAQPAAPSVPAADPERE